MSVSTTETKKGSIMCTKWKLWPWFKCGRKSRKSKTNCPWLLTVNTWIDIPKLYISCYIFFLFSTLGSQYLIKSRTILNEMNWREITYLSASFKPFLISYADCEPEYGIHKKNVHFLWKYYERRLSPSWWSQLKQCWKV